jgi:chemotaxis signal transduction protein
MNELPAIISTSHLRAAETAGSPVVGVQGGSQVTEPGQNLEQLSDEEFWDYARQLARQVPAAAQPEVYVTCKLSKGDCLIPLTTLYEVVGPPHRLALLPAIPEWMPGVVAWRGETIPVIDLDAYLSGYPAERPHEAMLLVANYAGLPVGLLVPAMGQTTPLQGDPSMDVINQEHSWYLPTQAALVKSKQGKALVLDVPLLLADVVQQIETAATHG